MAYDKMIGSLFLTLFWLVAEPRHADAQSVSGAQRVEFDSLDRSGGRAIRLFGWLFTAKGDGSAKAPLVIGYHGCGGLYGRDKDLNPRHRSMAELLRQEGYYVLFPDSFTPRVRIRFAARRSVRATSRAKIGGVMFWAH